MKIKKVLSAALIGAVIGSSHAPTIPQEPFRDYVRVVENLKRRNNKKTHTRVQAGTNIKRKNQGGKR